MSATGPATRPRRVVTGQRSDGRSYVARDEACEPSSDADRGAEGVVRYPVWGSDHLPLRLPFDGGAAPLDGGPTPQTTPGALRAMSPDPLLPSAVRAAFSRWAAGTELGPRDRGRRVLEVIVVVSGTLHVIADDGSKSVLTSGDTLVQHAAATSRVCSPEGAFAFTLRLGATAIAEGDRPTSAALGSARAPIFQAMRSGSGPRRVVTGERAGRSFIARDEQVLTDVPAKAGGEPATARTVDLFSVWAHDRLPPVLPFDGRSAPIDEDPSPDETPVALTTVNRQPRSPRSLRIAVAHFLPSVEAIIGPWHGNDTFDFLTMISGELGLEQDSGDRVTLRTGDAVIQHGTNHRWTWGGGGRDAILFVAKIGALRSN